MKWVKYHYLWSKFELWCYNPGLQNCIQIHQSFMEEQSSEVYGICHMCRVRFTSCGREHPSCRQCSRLYLQCIYHDKQIPRKFSQLSRFSKGSKASETKRRLIKRKGEVTTEGLPLPDDKLMDLFHRAAIAHCESVYVTHARQSLLF